MTWGYQIYIPKCLFSHRDDVPENLVKITPQKCKKSTSDWHALLKSVLAFTPFNVNVKQPCCPWNVTKWVISTFCLLNRTPSGFITPELTGICSCSRKSSSLRNGRKVAILAKHLWWWASSGRWDAWWYFACLNDALFIYSRGRFLSCSCYGLQANNRKKKSQSNMIKSKWPILEGGEPLGYLRTRLRS